MDLGVIEAMRRWPDVPAVYGWLSLTPRGEWRLHPLGDAARGGYGEGISNVQILSFINRNYQPDHDGCWFFQNGPQRVFVRVDAAPLILRMDSTTGQLTTHCGQIIQQVQHWWTDEMGRLFAQTDAGPALVDDRDLMAVGEILQTSGGCSLIELMEEAGFDVDSSAHAPARDPSPATRHISSEMSDPSGLFAALIRPAPLDRVSAHQIPACLGFVANPVPPHPANQAIE